MRIFVLLAILAALLAVILQTGILLPTGPMLP